MLSEVSWAVSSAGFLGAGFVIVSVESGVVLRFSEAVFWVFFVISEDVFV